MPAATSRLDLRKKRKKRIKGREYIAPRRVGRRMEAGRHWAAPDLPGDLFRFFLKESDRLRIGERRSGSTSFA